MTCLKMNKSSCLSTLTLPIHNSRLLRKIGACNKFRQYFTIDYEKLDLFLKNVELSATAQTILSILKLYLVNLQGFEVYTGLMQEYRRILIETLQRELYIRRPNYCERLYDSIDLVS